MLAVRRQHHERDYALLKLESPEGSEPHTLGNLGVHCWTSVHELWSWGFGYAVFSTGERLVGHSLSGTRDGSSRLCRQRIHAEGGREGAMMTMTPNYRTPADAGIALLFHIEHSWPRAAECGR